LDKTMMSFMSIAPASSIALNVFGYTVPMLRGIWKYGVRLQFF
jgi:hypothetical protein